VKHREKHPNLDVDGCFACRISGVAFSSAAMPNRKSYAASINATERQWDTDMAAYKRLRRDGLQPSKIDGSRTMEQRAEHAVQVETGIL